MFLTGMDLIAVIISFPLITVLGLLLIRKNCEIRSLLPTVFYRAKNRKEVLGAEQFSWVYRPTGWRRAGLALFVVLLFVASTLISSGNAYLRQHKPVFFVIFLLYFMLVQTGAHPIYYLATSQGLWSKNNPIIRPGENRPRRVYRLFLWNEIKSITPHENRLIVQMRLQSSWLGPVNPAIAKLLFTIEILLPPNDTDLMEAVIRLYEGRHSI